VSAYASVNGVDIYYEVHGRGRPLVLLHGALGTIESCFQDLLPALAASFRVIAVELQGHGHTPDVERPFSFGDMAEDVAGLLRLLGIETADVFGYSMGGGVGLELAIRHPRVVSRLAYVGGACYQPSGLYPAVLEGTSSQDSGELDDPRWRQSYERVAPDPGAWPRLLEKITEMDRSFAGWSPNQLRSLNTPVLLIIGDSDIVRPEHTVDMFRLLGGGVMAEVSGFAESQLAILPRTSHVGLLDRVEWLQSMSLVFFAGDNSRSQLM
jgi:pimeloyl-ACP methyl ester carboxylesterase